MEKSGAWFRYDSIRIGHGRENANNYLRETPDFAARLEQSIRRSKDEGGEALMGGPTPEDDA